MSTTSSPTARSIIYLCCIGGLLAVHAVLVVVIWNIVLESTTAPRQLTFLEGAGITAFVYVAVVSVRYGFRLGAARSVPTVETAWKARFMSRSEVDSVTEAAENDQTDAPEHQATCERHRREIQSMCDNLNDEQRNRLKAELARATRMSRPQ